MFRLFKQLKPLAKIFILVVILLAGSAMAELYLPGMMSDIINDGIYLDYEPMYEHEKMLNPFGEIDITGSVDGFEKDTIPVFEMKDGFSTVDIKTVWNEQFKDGYVISFDFMDIPVKDSRELFNEVLLPFMNSLRQYQFYKMTEKYGYKVDSYSQYKEEDKLAVKNAINKLMNYDSLVRLHDGYNGITIKNFLEMFDEDDEGDNDGDVWENADAKRLLTSCVLCMKHSENGNLLPIPVTTNASGETVRVAVDSNGVALDKSLLTYQYDKETERFTPFPDYEIILCNKVLGFAYKYENNQKWIKNTLGLSENQIEENVGNNIADKKGLARLAEILSLSKRGSTTDALSTKTDKTREEWLTPDGITIQTANMSFIFKKGLIMLSLTLLASALTITGMFLSSKIASYFSKVLRSMVFKKVEGFSLVEFDKFSTASLVTRSTNDINQIQNVFLVILRTTLSAPVTVIGGFIFSFRANGYMTMVLIYVLPILFIAAGVAAIVVQPLFKIIQKKVDQLTLIMREGITGIREVRAFGRQKHEKERFNEVNVSVTQTAVKLQRYTAVLVPLINICLNCCSVGIFWRAAQQVADDSITDIGKMLEVSQYITQIAMALVFLASAIVIFPRASASAERILQVVDTNVNVVDIKDAADNGDKTGTIQFQNVNFRYCDDAENDVLQDITFTCQKGKTTAIVGGTGSGKSTIIHLIPRFYDILSGSIKIDGQEVCTYPQAELRKKVGFVPQKSMLFSGTIAENLRYGNEKATDEELWEALKVAQSDAFVREKEDQLNYVVEQGGKNFSGGQKQRLSIARAIVRKPEIYIFDDSFSALDFKTDSRLRKALKAITKESIVIIVAQRIGTIMDADEIIVLDEGRIVGKGQHCDLIRGCKIYQDIALSQLSEEEVGL